MYGQDVNSKPYDIETVEVELYSAIVEASLSQVEINEAHEISLKLLEENYSNIPVDCIKWDTNKQGAFLKLTYYIELVKT